MVAARHEESVLFSIADLQVLEVRRRQEQAARGQPRPLPRPRLLVNPPPPVPLVQAEALPRNRSFWPALLVTGLVLLGGVAAAVVAIARNTEVLAVEPTPGATVAPTASAAPSTPRVEGLAPVPARPTETRLGQPRTEPHPLRAVTRKRARSRRSVRARRRARRRRAAARRRSRRQSRRQIAAVVKEPTPAPAAPRPAAPGKPLPTIDELITGRGH